jgi:hypothetical protein
MKLRRILPSCAARRLRAEFADARASGAPATEYVALR